MKKIIFLVAIYIMPITGTPPNKTISLIGNYYNSDFTNDAAKKKIQASKYSHLGGRSGLGSMLDSALIKDNINEQRKKVGSGFVKFRRTDGDDGPLNLNGRVFFPDSAGDFVLIDQFALEKMIEREEEKRNYIIEIVKKASYSNDICTTILAEDCNDLLGPSKGAPIIRDAALLAVDATPEAIQSYSEQSPAYANAIRKLKLVIEAKCPIVDNLTTKKAVNADHEMV